MIDLAKEIWQTMRTNKLRTFLTGFSVAWGIFMLILLLAISKGLIDKQAGYMAGRDNECITVWSGRTTMPYKGYKEGREISLRQKYFDGVGESSPSHIRKVEGELSLSDTVSTSKDYLPASEIVGVYPSKFDSNYKFISGRKINDADINERRKVVVLSKNKASVLFDNPKNAVGKIVRIGKLAFTVIGVYDHSYDMELYAPLTTAMALKGYDDKVYRMDVYMKNISSEEDSRLVESQVRSSLAQQANFDPNDAGAVYTYDRYSSSINQMNAMDYLNTAMWVIGVLTLITGIVGVSNIMFVSVRERTHEIGVRRAIGAKPRNILTQVVVESVTLTTCFGYIGIVMGTLATEAVKYIFANSKYNMNPTVDMAIAVEVTVALIIAGALAGIFPALRALKIRPVEALQEE